MAEEWCEGQLKGDPDIAGIGVTSSIMATAVFSIFLSYVLWYLRLLKGRDRTNSPAYRIVLKCAYMLSDIQLVTALAIIASSIILMRSSGETSLYHVFIARCLAQANLNAWGAALIFDTWGQTAWSLRLFLVVITLALYFWQTALSLQEFRAWSYRTPKCFYNPSVVPGEYTTWMYIEFPWQFGSFICVFLEANQLCETFVDTINYASFGAVVGVGTNLKNSFVKLGQKKFVQAVVHFIEGIWNLLVAFFFAITIFPPITAPFTATIFFVWNAYDVYTARAANRAILVVAPEEHGTVSLLGHQNPEDDIGFGQLLPWLLLLLPLLQVVDIVTEEFSIGRGSTPRATSLNRFKISTVFQQHSLRPARST